MQAALRYVRERIRLVELPYGRLRWRLRDWWPVLCFGCGDVCSAILCFWEWRRGWRCMGCLRYEEEAACTIQGHGHSTTRGEV